MNKEGKKTNTLESILSIDVINKDDYAKQEEGIGQDRRLSIAAKQGTTQELDTGIEREETGRLKCQYLVAQLKGPVGVSCRNLPGYTTQEPIVDGISADQLPTLGMCCKKLQELLICHTGKRQCTQRSQLQAKAIFTSGGASPQGKGKLCSNRDALL